ncbi:oligopeptide/dipeptide ABC transporter ATP-binding protein [Aquamicrobium sp. LC103]|uniref:ABC transporter ATP-binding protein n=1 Tax=Aquamicrobium sp. LC103 TaxID=1120658 RepID=UPI00063E7422|nr:oligopeptide/dipeptide ABC transporter ATP-binding protein [Aquamicrobium sp. LC103]TKT69928.1 ATP-binding cassette domain-containing protein [Aquamicrobium sp. LC103]
MPSETSDVLIEARNLRKWFPIRRGVLGRVTAHVKAVNDVSLSIQRGEVLAVVGESGSGKSTLGRLILRLMEATSGEIRLGDVDLTHLGAAELRAMRRRMQIVFQDPFSSLNPHMRIGDALLEILTVQRIGANAAERRARVGALLEQVGLRPGAADRFPHEFSGGQRQRIGIARALAVEPEFIVADEPVSALDVSIQAQVVNLLQDLKDELGLTIMFISHDLAVVRHIADRVAVLYLGRLMEIGPARDVFERPLHPYTHALLAAVPDPRGVRKDRILLKGDIPSPIKPPTGCVFRTRCPYALPACAETAPPLRTAEAGRQKACIREDILLPPRELQ